MCGIAGYIGQKRAEEGRVRQTLMLMNNRGPDHQGFAVFNEGRRQVCLLHARLKILDLDARANQPFQIGDYCIIYNGELYNYVEIRQQLEADGVVFKTTSDTEVLLQAFIRWGKECLKSFEGMWSLVIYDGKSGEIVMARDRFGEKPLYLLRTPDGIYFGSEVKFLKALSGESLSVNMRQLSRYLVNGYKSLYKTPETFFEGVEEFPRATCASFDGQGREKMFSYWQPLVKARPMTIDQAVEGFRERLRESVRLRLRSDVPMAFCLSGGVDSAALVSIAAKAFRYDVATFSLIDPDERYNEYANIRATIDDLGCRHTIIQVSRQGTLERLRQLVNYHDAPVYTISYYIHSFLSEAIGREGFRVVCSGTAADELVTGYYDHYNLHLYEMRDHPEFPRYLADWKKYVAPVVRNPYLRNPNLYFENPLAREHIYLNQNDFAACLREPFAEPFAEKKYCDSPLRNRMLNEMFEESIPVILHEDDLNSMFYSIENRSPYLDAALFDFAYSIPPEHLIRDGYNKYILRRAVEGVLNDTVRLDRRKKGFNASIHSILDVDEPQTRDYLLEDSPIFDLVRKDRVEDLLGRPKPFTNSYSKFIFSFLNAKMFLEMNSKVVHDCHC
ncbi:MAG: asparagine synthase (glutamine-hydrolyzing) [Candidatus Omnitrophota bacterium]